MTYVNVSPGSGTRGLHSVFERIPGQAEDNLTMWPIAWGHNSKGCSGCLPHIEAQLLQGNNEASEGVLASGLIKAPSTNVN